MRMRCRTCECMCEQLCACAHFFVHHYCWVSNAVLVIGSVIHAAPTTLRMRMMLIFYVTFTFMDDCACARVRARVHVRASVRACVGGCVSERTSAFEYLFGHNSNCINWYLSTIAAARP